MVHAAGMMAMFTDQVGQAPVQIQCVQQSAQEPWVKWLLPTLVQTVVSLLSIGAGVGIAVWSFRRNRQTEHAQWVRDQKRAEWKEILSHVRMISEILHPTEISRDKDAEYMWLRPCAVQTLMSLHASVFIWDSVEKAGFIQDWYELINKITDLVAGLESYEMAVIAKQRTPAPYESKEKLVKSVRDHHEKLRLGLEKLARADLGSL